MSKAVMISIQPWWCELIAQGMKTIEVRKTRPKLEPPFKCYIYCTLPRKSGDSFLVGGNAPLSGNGTVVGEFTCNSISEYEAEFYPGNDYYQNIKEIFRNPEYPDDECRDCCILTANDDDNPDDCDFCKRTCLTFEEVKAYIGEECFCKTFYGWHISDLVIYDKPKHLSYFCSPCDKQLGCDCNYCKRHSGQKPITRSPQNWCYVEEV